MFKVRCCLDGIICGGTSVSCAVAGGVEMAERMFFL